MKECWKDITGFTGLYQISNFGRVRSLDRTVVFSDGRKRKFYGKILSQRQDLRGGYLLIDLKIKKKVYCVKVHRLVALHFCKGYKKGLVVNHKDGNRQNNIYTNLEWCTQKENIDHASTILHKTWGGPIGRDNPRAKAIAQYKFDGTFITAYGCIREMSRETGFDSSSVCKALKGKVKQAYGFKWKYL